MVAKSVLNSSISSDKFVSFIENSKDSSKGYLAYNPKQDDFQINSPLQKKKTDGGYKPLTLREITLLSASFKKSFENNFSQAKAVSEALAAMAKKKKEKYHNLKGFFQSLMEKISNFIANRGFKTDAAVTKKLSKMLKVLAEPLPPLRREQIPNANLPQFPKQPSSPVSQKYVQTKKNLFEKPRPLSPLYIPPPPQSVTSTKKEPSEKPLEPSPLFHTPPPPVHVEPPKDHTSLRFETPPQSRIEKPAAQPTVTATVLQKPAAKKIDLTSPTKLGPLVPKYKREADSQVRTRLDFEEPAKEDPITRKPGDKVVIERRFSEYDDAKRVLGKVFKGDPNQKPEGPPPEKLIGDWNPSDPSAIEAIADQFKFSKEFDVIELLEKKVLGAKGKGQSMEHMPQLIKECLSNFDCEDPKSTLNPGAVFRTLKLCEEAQIDQIKDKDGNILFSPNSRIIVNSVSSLLSNQEYKENMQKCTLSAINWVQSSSDYNLNTLKTWLKIYFEAEGARTTDVGKSEYKIVNHLFDDFASRTAFVEELLNSPENNEILVYLLLWMIETEKNALVGARAENYLHEPYEECQKALEASDSSVPMNSLLSKFLLKYLQASLSKNKEEALIELEAPNERTFKIKASYHLLTYIMENEELDIKLDHPRVIRAMSNLIEAPQLLGADAKDRIGILLKKLLDDSQNDPNIYGSLMIFYVSTWKRRAPLNEEQKHLNEILLAQFRACPQLKNWAEKLPGTGAPRDLRDYFSSKGLVMRRDPSTDHVRFAGINSPSPGHARTPSSQRK